MLKFSFHRLLIVAAMLIFTNPGNYLKAQSGPSSWFVEFKDKSNSPYSVTEPLKFLSQKALNRRAKNHISVTEQDFPVNPWYVDSLKAAGARIVFTSRWFNAATVSVDTSLVIEKINKLTFVKSSEKVYKKSGNNTQTVEMTTSINNSQGSENEYGESFTQIAMLNGQFLHEKGYQGQGVLMAVIDAGFFKVDSLQAFSYLFSHNRIIAAKDFVKGNDSVYKEGTHGMIVLSTIAGRIPGKLLGTAPEANFLLLRSENASTEYLIEEDAWTVAAEYADSAGADVISSSLGYTTFDDPSMNHIYPEMDGKTTRVTRAANYAFSKGIVVLTSAGNEGNKAWKRISAPADGDSVIAVGAVNPNRIRANFSSLGPTSDKDVKPNVAAMGLATVVADYDDGQTSTANGTSLSCPVLAGLVACLVQAFPNKTAREIKKAIEMSSHRYTNPDDSLGYGIPDFRLAYQILGMGADTNAPEFSIIQMYPNPFTSDVTLTFFSKKPVKLVFRVTDNKGRTVIDTSYSAKGMIVEKINLGLNSIQGTGLYILTIDNGSKKFTEKLIKLERN